MNAELRKILENQIFRYENPKRIPLSVRYPNLRKSIMEIKRAKRKFSNIFNANICYKKGTAYFPNIAARHQSVLRRRLGDSNPRLQEQKIINIRQAIKKFDMVIIEPGKVFSFWNILGTLSRDKGYVDGMLISNGKVKEGLGGGLCQLANFFYWIWLHVPCEVVERYHHSVDIFPDSGRVLPFGSGATIVQNYIDLQIKNTSHSPIQIKIWLTDKHLKGQLLSLNRIPQKFHIFEKNHTFASKNQQYFRYNEIWREEKREGKIQKTQKIATNFAPVLYPINSNYFNQNNFTCLQF
ncbi:vancomycin resistance protein [Candidatus Gracilibacteria bacterium]|nr:MAG: vancomycin resistance protein [Candidatus Gracilibacteria bacterium]